MAIDLKQIKAGFDNFLDTKVSLLQKPHKIGILAASWVIPAALFFFLYYSPKNEEVDKLEKKKVGIEKEIKKVEAIIRQLPKHRAEKQEVELQYKAASLLLPEEKEIPSLLTNISGQGTASGLDFLSFKPKGERPQQFYAEIPVDITVSGPYHNVGLFLDKISKLPRIVTVNNITMSGPQQSENQMILSTKFELVTYRFIEPKPEAAPQKGKKGKRKK